MFSSLLLNSFKSAGSQAYTTHQPREERRTLPKNRMASQAVLTTWLCPRDLITKLYNMEEKYISKFPEKVKHLKNDSKLKWNRILVATLKEEDNRARPSKF